MNKTEEAAKSITELVTEDLYQMGIPEINAFVQGEAIKYHNARMNDIWHDAKKIPERSERIMIQCYGDYHNKVISIYEGSYSVAFKTFHLADGQKIDAIRWAYIKDLKPEDH